MGFLRDFGSRNHPTTRLRKADLKRAARGVQVTEEDVARFRAARAFLYAEWLGASIMVASFTLLYLLGLREGADLPTVFVATISLFILGTAVYWGAHSSYRRVDFPWAKRFDTAAIIVAGAGALFWAMFVVFEVLVSFGIPIAGP